MNRQPYKQYSREFKIEALRLANTGDKPATQVARELGIRVNQLHKWKQQPEAEEARGMPAKRGRPVDSELDRLRRENTRLREENDLLKKRPSSSRGNPHEASIHYGPSNGLPSTPPVPGFTCVDQRLLRCPWTPCQCAKSTPGGINHTH